jgi:hypothetical protein
MIGVGGFVWGVVRMLERCEREKTSMRVSHRVPSPVRIGVALSCWLACYLPAARGQYEYTPDHPEVREMVYRGIAAIEASNYRDIGPQCLHALAICEAIKRYEERIPLENPVVDRAVLAAKDFLLGPDGESIEWNTMYETALASVLLGVVDHEKYEPNIRASLRLLEKRQMDQGCWKYRGEGGTQNRGDTSQTQYCCLAIWAASNYGILGNPEVPRRALEWFFVTQTPSGGWVYRAVAGQQNQGDETLSIVTAAAGGVYMLLSALGTEASSNGSRFGKRAAPDLPAFITLYDPDAEKRAAGESARPKVQIDQAAATRAVSAVNPLIGGKFVPNPPEWTFYFLYSFERYAYFREKFDGQVSEVPDWYDQGVRFLKSSQQPDGTWRSTSVGEQNLLPTINTAFAILFLVRSTELLAGDPAKGTVRGNTRLQTGNLEYKNGQITSESVKLDVDDFLKHLESGDMDLEKFAAFNTAILLPADPAMREQRCRVLRALVKDEDAFKRLAAVKALGSVRDLNNAPALIAAMADDENEIQITAHNGLRFISRKMDSIKLSDQPSESEIVAARKHWIEWYKALRPDDRTVTE